jgi:hypothetical protein
MPDIHYTAGDGRSAASKFGQMIGEAFETVVFGFIEKYIKNVHTDYELLSPEDGQTTISLDMLGGSTRQMDTVITAKDSALPVALLESKWLKDARHHNDKGAWILQLREVRKKHPTVRGAAAILSGYWTEGVGVMLMGEGGVKMVLVATDEEIYSTLQGHLDSYLGDQTFELHAPTMRKRYPRPWDLANFLHNLKDSGKLDEIAGSWLHFVRGRDANNQQITGKDLIRTAIDDLLSPLGELPRVGKFSISLEITSGNIIHQEFDDVEQAIEFAQKYASDSEMILRRIMPWMFSDTD